MRFKWLSPLGAHACAQNDLDSFGGLVGMGLRASEPLLTVAAHACFGTLGIVQLRMLAKHLALDVPPDANLADVLTRLIMSQLKLSDEDLLATLTLRVKHREDWEKKKH